MAKAKIADAGMKKSYIVSLLREPYKNNIWGYRVVVLGSQSKTANKGFVTRDIPKNDVVNLLLRGNILENATLSPSGDDIEFTQGVRANYPQYLIGKGRGLASKNGLTIVYQVRLNDVDGKVLKYGVMDATGDKIYHVTALWLAQMGKTYHQTNYVVAKNPHSKSLEDDYIIRAKSGSFPITIFYDKRERLHTINSKTDSEAVQKQKREENEVIRANLKDIQADRANKYRQSEELAEKATRLVKEMETELYDRYHDAITKYNSLNCNTSNESTLKQDAKSEVVKAREAYVKALERAKANLVKQPANKDLLPYIEVDRSVDTLIHRSIEVDFNKKMQMVLDNIKKLAPYFSSMLSAIPVQRTMSIQTMAVNETKLYINPEFLNTLSIGEATFILIHEMMHIKLNHSCRGIGKKHMLWNIACDLIINEKIRQDFVPSEDNADRIYGKPTQAELMEDLKRSPENRLYPDRDIQVFRVNGNDTGNAPYIKCPDIGVFAETLEIDVDMAKITEESIYNMLLLENGSKSSSEQVIQKVPYDGLSIAQVMTRLVEIAQQAKIEQKEPSIPYDQINLEDIQQVTSHVGDILWGEVVQLDTMLDELDKVKQQNTTDPDLMSRTAEKFKRVGEIFGSFASSGLLPDMTNKEKEYEANWAKANPNAEKPPVWMLFAKPKKEIIYPDTRYDMNTIISSMGRIADVLAITENVPDFNSSPQLDENGDDDNNLDNQSGGSETDDGGADGNNSTGQGEGSEGEASGGQASASKGSGSDGQGDGSGEQGNGSGSGSANGQGENSENDENSSDGFDGQGSDGEGSDGEGSDEESSDGEGSGDWDDAGQESTQNENNSDGILGDDSDFNNEEVEVELVVQGKNVKVKMRNDIMGDKRVEEEVTKGNQPKPVSNQINKRVQERVVQQVIKDFNSNDSKQWGEGIGSMFKRRQAFYEEAERRDWRKLLENLCKPHKDVDFSLARPNGMWQRTLGITVASEMEVEGKPKIRDLKICVDTSGSISDEILSRIYSEIAHLLNKYHIKNSELIFWDTSICNTGEFDTMEGMLKINPLGGGGTDVNCVFKYLNKEVPFRGKYEKSKPKDMTAILIFTDGWFSPPDMKYEKLFGNKVLWVIYDKCSGIPNGLINPKTDEIIFGKVSLLDKEV